jgi:hypothetical protein
MPVRRKQMKKLLSKVLVVLSLLTVSASSQALVVGDIIVSSLAFNASSYDRYTTIETITDEVGAAALCVLFLPICVLSEEETQATGITVEGLTEKGYENAKGLIAEQKSCMARLEANGQKLVLEDNETEASIEAGLVDACDASTALVNLYQNEIL